jgi:DNA adenine methylase
MMEPIWRWAGGKRWLSKAIAGEIAQLKPKIYVEPFLGAGAVALAVDAERYLLGDANDALMNLWHHAVYFPELVYLQARVIEQEYGHSEEGYSGARNLLNALRGEGHLVNDPETEADRDLSRMARSQLAALALYLLAHGYNGLWRENKSGEFNVPFGGAHQSRFRYPTEAQLHGVSTRFRDKATFFPTDFEVLIREAPKGAVLYADPPYVGTFDQYTKEAFPEAAQRRLAFKLEQAANRGVHVFASNAYHPLVHEIYGSWADIFDVNERWSVGATGERRGKKACVLIRSRG